MRGRLAPLAVQALRPPAGVVHGQRARRQPSGSSRWPILVYDRTRGRRADGGVLHRRQVPARPARAGPDGAARPDRRCGAACRPSTCSRPLVFAALALIAHGDFVLRARAGARLCSTARWPSPAARLTRGAVAAVLQPAGLLKEGNALMNVGFAVVVGRRRGARRPADRRSSASRPRCSSTPRRSSRSRCSWRSRAAFPRAHVEQRAVPRAASAPACASRARNPIVRLLLVGQALALVLFTLVDPDRGHLREGEPRDDQTPASASCSPRGARASWSAASIYLLVKQRSPLGADRRLDGARSASPTSGMATARDAARRVPDLDRRRRRATASSGSPWSPRCRR